MYEYFRARRPILALTDARGDTAGVLRDGGIDTIVPLDDASAIARGLVEFLAQVHAGTAPVAGDVERHSRRGRTAELAEVLAAASRPAQPPAERPNPVAVTVASRLPAAYSGRRHERRHPDPAED